MTSAGMSASTESEEYPVPKSSIATRNPISCSRFIHFSRTATFLQVRPLSPQFLYTPDGHCIWKAHAGYGLKIPLRPTQNDARKNWLKSQFFSGAACPIFREFLTLPHKYKNQAL